MARGGNEVEAMDPERADRRVRSHVHSVRLAKV